MTTNNEKLQNLVESKYIVILGFRKHTKASEKYVDVVFIQDDGFVWEGSIPYYYRRTGLFIETEEELAAYLTEIRPLFEQEKINAFTQLETERWNNEMAGKQTTKGFFDKLLNLQWNSVKHDLPNNPNWARRVQDIKEFGYTLATDTNRLIAGSSETDTHIMLIPIPKGGTTGYEVMTPAFKAKAFAALQAINVYEVSKGNKHGLLPDHKFPEIRWDEETMAENPAEMPEDEIREKFQLIDNQRNQQKREVCRKCYQTGQRGTIYGINYFYEGTDTWPEEYPKRGKAAEQGCVGCGWYDIQAWRDSLNNFLKENKL